MKLKFDVGFKLSNLKKKEGKKYKFCKFCKWVQLFEKMQVETFWHIHKRRYGMDLGGGI